MGYADDWKQCPCSVCGSPPATPCEHDEPMPPPADCRTINVTKLRHIRAIVAGWGSGYLPELAALDHAISVLEQREGKD